MSATSSPVSAAHIAYLAARTRQEDPFLAALKRAAGEAGIPPIWIGPEQASFMQILLRLAGAKRVVEVGTLAGLSAIVMARALPKAADGGCLRTVELAPRHAAFARDWIARSDVNDRIEVLQGAGKEVLPGIPDAWADVAFLDADKSGYAAYLDEALRFVRPGGMILVDNAFAFGRLFDEESEDPEVAAVRAFNELMASEARLHGIIVPIGDGLWVAAVESTSS